MGKGGSSEQTIGYKYYVGLHLVLARSVTRIKEIVYGERTAWTGDIYRQTDGSTTTITINKPELFGGEEKQGGISGDFEFLWGYSGQTQNAYLASQLGTENLPAYRNCCSVVAHQPYMTAISPTIHATWFKCINHQLTNGSNLSGYNYNEDYGMNPAQIIYECLTNAEWGMGYSTSMLDTTSFSNAASTLNSEGFWLSFKWTKSQPLEDFIGEIQEHIDSTLYIDRITGKFTLKLIRQDYDVSSLTAYDESTIVEITEYKSKAIGEIVNELIIEYTDLERYGEKGSVTVQDIASQQTQGFKNTSKKSFLGITNQDLAARVGMRELTALTSPLSTVRFKANRLFWDVEIGNVFILNWEDYNIEGKVFRVSELDYGDFGAETISVTAIEDAFVTEQTSYIVKQPTLWVSPNSQPYQLTHWKFQALSWWDLNQIYSEDSLSTYDPYNNIVFDVLAGDNVGDTLSIETVVNYNDTNSSKDYAEQVIESFPCPLAFLDGDITATQTTIPFGEHYRRNQVSTGSEKYLLIDDEKMRITGKNDASYTVYRGVDNTLPATHSDGAKIWFPTARETTVDKYTNYGIANFYYWMYTETTLGKYSSTPTRYSVTGDSIRTNWSGMPLPPRFCMFSRDTSPNVNDSDWVGHGSTLRDYANNKNAVNLYASTRNKTVEIGTLNYFYQNTTYTPEATDKLVARVETDTLSSSSDVLLADFGVQHQYTPVNMDSTFGTKNQSARIKVLAISDAGRESPIADVGQIWHEPLTDQIKTESPDYYWRRLVTYPNTSLIDEVNGLVMSRSAGLGNDIISDAEWLGANRAAKDAYFYITGDQLPDLGAGVTLTMWCKPWVTTENYTLLARGNASETGVGFAIKVVYNNTLLHPEIVLEVAGQTTTVVGLGVADRMMQFTLVIDRTSEKALLYIDGWQSAEIDLTGITIDSCALAPIAVFAEPTSHTTYTLSQPACKLERLAIWNSVLTQTQVETNFAEYFSNQEVPLETQPRKTTQVLFVGDASVITKVSDMYEAYFDENSLYETSVNFAFQDETEDLPTNPYIDVIWCVGNNPSYFATLATKLEAHMAEGGAVILSMSNYDGTTGADNDWLGAHLNISGNMDYYNAVTPDSTTRYYMYADRNDILKNSLGDIGEGNSGLYDIPFNTDVFDAGFVQSDSIRLLDGGEHQTAIGVLPETSLNNADARVYNVMSNSTVTVGGAQIALWSAGATRLNSAADTTVNIAAEGWLFNDDTTINADRAAILQELPLWATGRQAFPNIYFNNADVDDGQQVVLGYTYFRVMITAGNNNYSWNGFSEMDFDENAIDTTNQTYFSTVGITLLGTPSQWFDDIEGNYTTGCYFHPYNYPLHIGIQFSEGQNFSSYSLKAGQNSSETPTAWELQASKDGINWTTIDTQTGVGWSDYQKKTFPVNF